MGSFFFWLLFSVCVIALVVLFFPFTFRIEFEAGEWRGLLRLFLFKKLLWTGEKQFRKEPKMPDVSKKQSSAFSDDDLDCQDDGYEPTFVETKPAVQEKMTADLKPESGNVNPTCGPEGLTQKLDSMQAEPSLETVNSAQPEADAPSSGTVKPTQFDSLSSKSKVTSAASSMKPAAPSAPVGPGLSKPLSDASAKKEKRKLTDREFWTILLTPDLDDRALRYTGRILRVLVRVFEIRFDNCFIEGIRMDYEKMGYAAALNGFLKGFPFFENWELRMDWCRCQPLKTAGKIWIHVNLCRTFAFLLAAAFDASILFVLFWRRRNRVLKTGELPELDFIRQKIIGWIVEE